jgi:phosphohistidine phosphatase
MKYLYLMRHGQSEPQSGAQPDRSRPLTAEGITRVRETAVSFRTRTGGVDDIMASPAVRARQTAEFFLQELSLPVSRIRFIPELYGDATVHDVLKIIRRVPDTVTSLLIVGHNPLMAELTSALCPSFAGVMPPGALAAISLPDAWKEIRPGSGSLDSFTISE